ncbi:DUF4142 domain-containing protein [Streptomyces pseudovenezuelae]|uniref:DUF4142 domain-containing protein n=1 Tax=Streptomyces pseudovenezuelae TaxID=67350 RepID=UPI002E8131B7|nr:DUF4142 domain-containing protein [Streptomyces pseudovenezuelae]WUA85862.1 DUF4142 domain-containing protein [Streptomyces pseudovenezuelae]
MHLSRTAVGSLFLGGALAATLGSLLYPAMLGVQKASSTPDRIIAAPESGKVSEADRDFVVKVRAAGLWEYSVGLMALQKNTTKAIRTAGQQLASEDASLDAACRRTAGQLGITLPDQPSPQQLGFVSRLNADSPEQFGADMATTVRAVDGQLLMTIASVRSTTKNSLIRALAADANETVLDHIKVVEKTGLVDFDQAVFQETSPPSPPAHDLTPPPPAAGQPQVTLTPPADSTVSPRPMVE